MPLPARGEATKKRFKGIPYSAAMAAALHRTRIVKERWYDPQKEALVCFRLDGQRNLQDIDLIALGGLNCVYATAREAFRTAISAGSAGIVLMHNHPCGDAFPSEDDNEFTGLLAAAGKIVGVMLVDHVIMADNSYYSFRDGEITYDRETRDLTPSNHVPSKHRRFLPPVNSNAWLAIMNHRMVLIQPVNTFVNHAWVHPDQSESRKVGPHTHLLHLSGKVQIEVTGPDTAKMHTGVWMDVSRIDRATALTLRNIYSSADRGGYAPLIPVG